MPSQPTPPGEPSGRRTSQSRKARPWWVTDRGALAAIAIIALIGLGFLTGTVTDALRDDESVSVGAVDAPTNPQQLAAGLEAANDPSLRSPDSYFEVSSGEFEKMMFPSGDLDKYQYPFVGSRIVFYGKINELAPDFDTSTAGTYFEASISHDDLGPLVGLSSGSAQVAIVGEKANLGVLAHGDNLKIFAEIGNPYLTGDEMFGSKRRDPFLVAHIVEVLR
ncbi:hypothetical protein [Rhodococcus sp. Q]|uniref:hypothetical protein n=1 Tax=Rhodococcus sp. Q TaxID=2502252 RepID=UPI0010F96BB6|nr:hypothetical protein [Rhodococcus sp. Q]